MSKPSASETARITTLLPSIASALRKEIQSFVQQGRTTIMTARRGGALLNEAKRELRREDFALWRDIHFPFGDRAAQHWQRIDRKWDELEPRLDDLNTITAALSFLSTPREKNELNSFSEQESPQTAQNRTSQNLDSRYGGQETAAPRSSSSALPPTQHMGPVLGRGAPITTAPAMGASEDEGERLRAGVTPPPGGTDPTDYLDYDEWEQANEAQTPTPDPRPTPPVVQGAPTKKPQHSKQQSQSADLPRKAVEPTHPRKHRFDLILEELTRTIISNTITYKDKEVFKTIVRLTEELRQWSPAASSFSVPLPAWIDGDMWDQYIVLRNRDSKPVTAAAACYLLEDLDSFRRDGYDPNLILKRSIISGWRGVFKPTHADKANGKANFFGERTKENNDRIAGLVASQAAALGIDPRHVER